MTQVIELKTVSELTTFSSATIYRLIKKGEFPRQIKLSERSSGWLLDDIKKWLEQRIIKSYGENL